MTNFNKQKVLRNAAVTCLSVALVSAPVSFAQLPTATILGVVTDRTGAVVPEASLTARNVNTGQSRGTVSAPDGSYRFSALPVGSYEIQVGHAGFQSQTRSGLTLVVGQEAVVNFVLEVGAVEQRVDVTADAPLVNTTSGSLGGLVDERKVAELPLNGRNFLDLTLLQPGVQEHKNVRHTSIQRSTPFSSNGAPLRANNFLLDGARMSSAFGDSIGSYTGSSLGVEGIREFRVITNSFSAEYGMNMGSQVMIVSKNGTNQFHGSLFEYLRNSALDARNFFDYKTATNPRRLPAFTRNQFGASFGGPIRRDATHFQLVYEGLRERLGLTKVNDVVPPSAKVDGGLVPQINPVVKPLLALFPDPNLPNNQFTFPATQAVTENYGQARVDQNISESDTLFVRYTLTEAQQTEPQNYPQVVQAGLSRSQYATISESHIFSPTLLNLFRFSYSRTRAVVDRINNPELVGPQLSFIPGEMIGSFTVGGTTDFSTDRGSPSASKQNLFTWSDDLFYTRGPHSLKFGVLINRFQQWYINSRDLRGAVQFGNVQDFLLGIPSQIRGAALGSVFDRTYHFTTLGFYVQDDWRVRSGLTLNLGLRYEFNTTPEEVNGLGSAIRDIQHDAEPTPGPPFINSSLRNWSPRFGFAWDVTGDSKTAVRGGFGLLYDIANLGTALRQGAGGTPPYSRGIQIRNPGPLTLPLVFPPGGAIDLNMPDYLMEQPHMLHYNLTVERQLPFEMALTLAYGGSRGINLTQIKEGNPTVPELIDGRFFYPVGARRVNPNWGSARIITAGGNSWYNSLQFGLNKRLTRGLQFQSSYTWSKIIDDHTGQSGSDSQDSDGTVSANPHDRKAERGPAAFDLRHNWRFNAIYRVPDFVPASALGKMLNGWWVSGILSVHNGYPFTPVLQTNRSRSGTSGGTSNTDRPDRVEGRNQENTILGGPIRYYDPGAFTLQPIGFLGNAGRNFLQGPGLVNLDFSLSKDTPLGFLGEAGTLQFRAEFFNLLNRVNFSFPNRTVFAGRRDGEAPLSNAGRITATNTTSRQIQFSLRLAF